MDKKMIEDQEHSEGVTWILHFNDMLEHRQVADVDAELRSLDPTTLKPSVMLSILNATYCCRTILPGRTEFVNKVEKVLIDTLGEERAIRLLKNRR